MPDDERIQEIVRRALERRAENAPSQPGLAARVRARLARRRRRRVAGATVACLAVVAGFTVGTQLTGPAGDGDRDLAGPDRPDRTKPQEWRWENFGGVQVQVPDSWGYGATGQPPCLPDPNPRPYVGRPGVVPMIGCSEPLPKPDQRVPYVWFASPEPVGVREYDAGWVAETREADYLRITVLSDDADLRRRILGSIRVREPDHHGCPWEHNAATYGFGRPRAVDGGLETVGDVDSVSVCRYWATGWVVDGGQGPLISSSKLTGDAARDLVQDMLAAPEGSGPDDPGLCRRATEDGDQAMLLLVRGSNHVQSVVMRYSGCVGHGIDDGAVERRLTSPVVQTVLVGPHRPDNLKPPVADLLNRRRRGSQG